MFLFRRSCLICCELCIDTCRFCLDVQRDSRGGEGNLIVDPVGDEAPRNCCTSHPMCTYVFNDGTLCNKLSFDDTPYCEKHNEHINRQRVIHKKSSVQVPNFVKGDGLCHGISRKKKKRCGAKGVAADGGKFYCQDHVNQAVHEVVVEEDAMVIPGDDELEAFANDSVENQDDVAEEEDQIDWRTEFKIRIDRGDIILLEPPFPTIQQVYVQCCGRGAQSKRPCPSKIRYQDATTNWLCPLHASSRVISTPSISELVTMKETLRPVRPVTATSSGSVVEAAAVPVPVTVSAGRLTSDSVEGEAEISSVKGNTESILDDAVNAVDDVNGNIHPDELAYDSADDFGDALNEDQIRLREIIDDSEADEILSDDDNDGNASIYKESRSIRDYNETSAMYALKTWSWAMSMEQRWNSLSSFLKGMSTCIFDLRLFAEEYVSDARREKNEAGAQAFKASKLIGATVVGAARRLDAIRASEPFAVVVEEACEVMEPTIIAVLAVKSLQKLELVGDHRQLPAFIQNCWFNLETTQPSIKTSLFERLISGIATRKARGKGRRTDAAIDPLPFTVLDEQRRMRKCIADITRPDYADIVTITDHPYTARQLIGEMLLKGGDKLDHMRKSQRMELLLHRPLWPSQQSRAVPGIQTPLFFWNLAENKEGRSPVGLSQCNQFEAAAVTGLVKHLLLCGIPASSISIITPYKGQKIAIIKSLRKAKCLPYTNHDSGGDMSATVMVSTVDRYQGDENDIVILSLVKTTGGNRFVCLLNRFIVAVSRARLGFYIVGNVNAVTKNRKGEEGPEHWRRFIDHLASSTAMEPTTDTSHCSHEDNSNDTDSNDTDGENDSEDGGSSGILKNVVTPVERSTFVGSSVGELLPLCCPRHPEDSKLGVREPSMIPSEDKWNTFCKKSCPALLPYCRHPCQIACHSPVQIPHTPLCTMEVPRPCDLHFDKPLVCSKVRGSSTMELSVALKKFKCDIMMPYRRLECHHIESISCYNLRQVQNGNLKLTDCYVIVSDFIQPSCGHKIKKPKCCERRQYESKPPQCQAPVVLKKICGCSETMLCWQAAREAASPTPCVTAVTALRPRCHHQISLRCHIATELISKWDAMHDVLSASIVDDCTQVEHGVNYGPSESNVLALSLKLPACNNAVTYKHRCGHWMKDVECSKAFHYAANVETPPPCRFVVQQFVSPFCMHPIAIECNIALQLSAMNPWDGANMIADDNLIISEELLMAVSLKRLSSKMIQVINSRCSKKFTVVRACCHSVDVPCNQMIALIKGSAKLPRCEEKVDRLLDCSHKAVVGCYSMSAPPPKCNVKVDDIYDFPCGIHFTPANTCSNWRRLLSEKPECEFPVEVRRYRCNHAITVKCQHSSQVTEFKPLNTLVALDSLGYTVYHDGQYCNTEVNILPCEHGVTFSRGCGHLIYNVKCTDAFHWAANPTSIPPCTALVNIPSPLCEHELSVPCHLNSLLEGYSPWKGGDIPGCAYTASIDTLTGKSRQSRVVDQSQLPIPSALPSGIAKDTLDCGMVMKLIRLCGHEVERKCYDIFYQPGVCQESVDDICPDCGFMLKMSCSSKLNIDQSGIREPCANVVETVCNLCHVNEVKSRCSDTMEARCRRNVTKPLACGHAVTYQCGDDDVRCRACAVSLWQKSVDEPNTPLAIGKLRHSIEMLIRNSTHGLEEVSRHDLSPLFGASLDTFLRTRTELMETMLNIVKNNMKLEVLYPPLGIDSEEEIEAYHVVFEVIPNAKVKSMKGSFEDLKIKNDIIRKFTTPQSTPYGRGCCFTRLTSVNDIEPFVAEGEDTVTMVIGIAMVYRTLKEHRPFLKPPQNKRKGRDNREEEANAIMKTMKVTQGYDSVQMTSQPTKYVYWYPGSVLPLKVMTLKLREECCICNDATNRLNGKCLLNKCLSNILCDNQIC